MVRHYVRKYPHRVGIRSPELLQRARDLISDGNSIRKTAETLGIPLSTLRDALKKVPLILLANL
jgi:transposase-like protein